MRNYQAKLEACHCTTGHKQSGYNELLSTQKSAKGSMINLF